MSDIFSFTRGTTPLLVSIPHDGRNLMPGQSETMTDIGRTLPDTDWHVRQLYDFAAGLGASVIAANYSRYVVDLNRAADDAALYDGQLSTGLCPARTFAGEPLYNNDAAVSGQERKRRVASYWRPYHEKLQATLNDLKEEFGYALLWDSHSIKSNVPSLFTGQLPDLNFGTNDGACCAAAMLTAVQDVARGSQFTAVTNGRFKGGFITRNYGNPEGGVHAIQLELAQKTYLDEGSTKFDVARATTLQELLAAMLNAYIESAGKA